MKYEIIYGDFPWPYTSFGTAKLPYKCLTEEQIRDFPIMDFAAKRCVMFLWVTGPKLMIAARCFDAWCERYGLRYIGVSYKWVKTKKDGTPIKASGPRPTLVKPLGEDVLAFTTVKRGRPFPLLTEAQVQWCFEEDAIVDSCEVLAPKPGRGAHSRKPAIVRDKIVELLGDRPRIELFARERVEGWTGWGDEYPSA